MKGDFVLTEDMQEKIRFLSNGTKLQKEITLLKRTIRKTNENHLSFGGKEELQLYHTLTQQIKKLCALRRTVYDTIFRVQDTTLRRLLILRYAEEKTWEKISAEMAYDLRHIYRLHKKALDSVELPTKKIA